MVKPESVGLCRMKSAGAWPECGFQKSQGAPLGSPVIFGKRRQVNDLRYSPVTSSLIQV